MGGATLLGTSLTGFQGLRGPLGWEPAEAAGTNDVVSKATGVDIAHREPAPTEPEKTTVRRHFYHVLSLTIALADCLISVYSHTPTAATLLLSTACAAAYIRRGWPTGIQPISSDQIQGRKETAL